MLYIARATADLFFPEIKVNEVVLKRFIKDKSLPFSGCSFQLYGNKDEFAQEARVFVSGLIIPNYRDNPDHTAIQLTRSNQATFITKND